MVQALKKGMQSRSTFRFAIENLPVLRPGDGEVSGEVWMKEAVSLGDLQSLRTVSDSGKTS